MKSNVQVLDGPGRARACTYIRGCGAQPTARIKYVYPAIGKAVTFGACARHAGQYAGKTA